MTISLDIAKKQCRIDGDYDNELLQIYIDSATAWVETHTGLALSERQVVEQFECFGAELKLSTRPVKSIESIVYLDPDGNEQTFTDVRVWRGQRIVPQVNHAWPNKLSKSDVVVSFTAGFDDDAAPKELLQAIRLLVAHQYEHREAVIIGTISSSLPLGVQSLVGPFRPQGV